MTRPPAAGAVDLHRSRDEKEAEAAAAVQVVALQGGTFVDPSKGTVEEFLHRWLRDYVEPSLALRTPRRYREIVEHDLAPFIGKVPGSP